MKEKINIGIIGGSGYTGLELVKILKNHKYSNIAFLTSRTYKNKEIGKIFPSNDAALYKSWYGKEHTSPGLLSDFIYGLPEINRDLIENKPRSNSRTGAPLLKAGHKLDNISIDSKSGVSGAGRKLKEQYLFDSLSNNFYAYSPKNHRHIGEMEQEIKKISGHDYKIDFTPHLLPVSRGIFSSIYCKTMEEYSCDFEEKIIKVYTDFYSDSIFVKVLTNNVPELKDVVGTNRCLIGINYDGRTSTLKIFSTIDNLLKGAAGQAVQNMNLMFGLEESEGLISDGIYS